MHWDPDKDVASNLEGWHSSSHIEADCSHYSNNYMPQERIEGLYLDLMAAIVLCVIRYTSSASSLLACIDSFTPGREGHWSVL
jgi:hypothetical protein